MLYIFDKDWTICYPKDGGKFINKVEQQVLMPGIAEACAYLKAEGHKLAVASNQGGVAYGIMSAEEAQAIVEHAARLIGADAYKFCPHHPDGNNEYAIACACRKPAPGMILDLADFLDTPLDEVVFVGDMSSDEEAAKNAGVEFVWADSFFMAE